MAGVGVASVVIGVAVLLVVEEGREAELRFEIVDGGGRGIGGGGLGLVVRGVFGLGFVGGGLGVGKVRCGVEEGVGGSVKEMRVSFRLGIWMEGLRGEEGAQGQGGQGTFGREGWRDGSMVDGRPVGAGRS